MTQSKQRALLVGPTFLDIYFIGKPTRLDYSAAIPVVTVDTIAYALGGAGVVAQGLKHLGLDVTLVTALGGGESAGQIAALLDEANIPVSACNLSEYRPPTITRVYTDKRLVACFEMDTHELQVQDHVSDMFKRATTTKPDVIVIADYGNAVITPDVLEVVLGYAKENKVPVIALPADRRLLNYHDCHFLVVSERQLDGLITPVQLFKELHPKHLVVTSSRAGATLHTDTELKNYAALPAIYRCNCGASEAVLSALANATAVAMTSDEALKYSMAAGAAAVEFFGAVPITVPSLMRKLAYYGVTKETQSGQDDPQAATPSSSS